MTWHNNNNATPLTAARCTLLRVSAATAKPTGRGAVTWAVAVARAVAAAGAMAGAGAAGAGAGAAAYPRPAAVGSAGALRRGTRGDDSDVFEAALPRAFGCCCVPPPPPPTTSFHRLRHRPFSFVMPPPRCEASSLLAVRARALGLPRLALEEVLPPAPRRRARVANALRGLACVGESWEPRRLPRCRWCLGVVEPLPPDDLRRCLGVPPDELRRCFGDRCVGLPF